VVRSQEITTVIGKKGKCSGKGANGLPLQEVKNEDCSGNEKNIYHCERRKMKFTVVMRKIFTTVRDRK